MVIGPSLERTKALFSLLEFQPVILPEVLEVLGEHGAATRPLDSFPFWLVKASGKELVSLLMEIVSISFRRGRLLTVLEETGAENLANYQPVSHLPFLGRVMGRLWQDNSHSI